MSIYSEAKKFAGPQGKRKLAGEEPVKPPRFTKFTNEELFKAKSRLSTITEGTFEGDFSLAIKMLKAIRHEIAYRRAVNGFQVVKQAETNVGLVNLNTLFGELGL